MTNVTKIAGFKSPIKISGTPNLPVYESKVGSKPLIILHELPGMTPSFIEYCNTMASKGFKIYMPLLFKSPGTEMRAFEMGLFCISYEFNSLFKAKDQSNSRPFTKWLLQLVDHVASKNPDQKIGVVGMCLTGGFSIAAIAHPNVNAAVLCQPAYPFFSNFKTLGLSEEEIDNVKQGAQRKSKPCAKAYRYKGDALSREHHMKAAKNMLGDSFERFPDIEGHHHSTLTGDHPSEEVEKDVLQFLSKRLS